VADVLVSDTGRTTKEGLEGTLERLCKFLAVAGGVTLTVMAFMSLASIAGRTLFDKALLGDYELVQIFSAVAVGMTLPYCHWVGGHVIVDFFTANAKPSTNGLLDGISNALLSLVSAIMAWRLTVGLIDLRGSEDASMLLNIPTWWGYVPLVPSFALLAVTGLFQAVQNFKKVGAA